MSGFVHAIQGRGTHLDSVWRASADDGDQGFFNGLDRGGIEGDVHKILVVFELYFVLNPPP